MEGRPVLPIMYINDGTTHRSGNSHSATGSDIALGQFCWRGASESEEADRTLMAASRLPAIHHHHALNADCIEITTLGRPPSVGFCCRPSPRTLKLEAVGPKLRIRSRNTFPKAEDKNMPAATSSLVNDIPESVLKPPSSDVLEVWRSAEAVCFDVDSTVCQDEGIDELAAFCGAGDAVAAWTARAMGGSVPFEVALASRLDLFRPSMTTLAAFLASKAPKLSPGIVDLVSELHGRGTDVYLISGGFRQMIEPVSSLLQIPKERVYANNLLFREDGEFAGFDANEPTSRSGGKAAVIEKIKQECGYKKLVMIGDGATDLEARRPGGAEIFICYGGVVARPNVMVGADWFVSSFTDLLNFV